MKTFILFDGAMAHGMVSSMPVFSIPDAPWFTALMIQEATRLAGPVLVDKMLYDELPDLSQAGAHKVASAFPHLLHMSFISTDVTVSLDDLARHLRRFMHFTDQQGEAYGLRIADCRVLAYLPTVLTPVQWNALTAPMQAWQIHDRKGTECRLTLDEARHAGTTDATPLHLDPDQIERLMDAGEADALLAAIDRPPELTQQSDIQRHFELASQCITRWRASGSHDRSQLLDLARRSFNNARSKS
jgi:hypothetical protein